MRETESLVTLDGAVVMKRTRKNTATNHVVSKI
jgi:hypothetical protein